MALIGIAMVISPIALMAYLYREGNLDRNRKKKEISEMKETGSISVSRLMSPENYRKKVLTNWIILGSVLLVLTIVFVLSMADETYIFWAIAAFFGAGFSFYRVIRILSETKIETQKRWEEMKRGTEGAVRAEAGLPASPGASFEHPESEIDSGGSCASFLLSFIAFGLFALGYLSGNRGDFTFIALLFGLLFASPLLLISWQESLSKKEKLTQSEISTFEGANLLLKLLKWIGWILLIIGGIYFISSLSPLTIIIILLVMILANQSKS